MNYLDALGCANAIVRLAYIRRYATFHVTEHTLHVDFFAIPRCRCCPKALDPQRWLTGISAGYEKQMVEVALAEENNTQRQSGLNG